MNNIKRNLACCAMAVLLVGAMGASAASNVQSVTYNKAGIICNRKTVTTPGTWLTAEDGERIPSVITYTDAKGKDNNYVSLQQMSDFFDIPILWDDEASNIVLGSLTLKNSFMVTGGTASGEEEFEITNQVDYHPTLTNTTYDAPILGLQAGGFTETDPANIPADAKRAQQATYKKTIIANDQVHEYEDGIPGATTRISFTNHSKETQSVYIFRSPHGSLFSIQQFAKVKIAPEQTVTRAFYLEKDAGAFARTLT